ncbi:ABC transporter permease [Natronococcus occultus]|uniref:Cell division protein n=1 Tax=Natronococcus occultus SP4 TaxID=694430 RepID=L0K2P9_9EURY|nr:ABC transporter permease [Natronococcus occultus]AGB38805.1 cell division protein [Natronococcus occultus SP4]
MRLSDRLVAGRTIIELGLTQLRHTPGRTVLAIGGVVLAVLSVTLLAGLGIGVVETGQDTFDDSGLEIWVTGGPGAEATTDNEVVGTQTLTDEIRDHEGVSGVVGIAMHEIYVGPQPDETELTTTVGIEGSHSQFERADEIEDGAGILSRAVVVDPAIAERHDLTVGDPVYIGASPQTVEAFTVAEIGSYAQYTGTETVALQLGTLQRTTGTASADRASFVAVTVADDVDQEAVQADLQAAHPDYDVRSSDDQFAAMVTDQALVVASGVALVGLAVVGGIALTGNLFVLVAYQQRETLSALHALGLSRAFLAGLIGIQGALIGLLGGVVALLATPVLAAALNRLSTAVLGFERLVRTGLEIYVLGLAVALVVGTAVALGAGWYAGRAVTVTSVRT